MKTSSQAPIKPRPRREATDGNQLWKLDRGLNWTQGRAFRAYLADLDIPFATFQKQSQTQRTLGSVPTKNFMLYRSYFIEAGLIDILDAFWAEQPVSPGSPASDQFHANDRAAQ